MNKPKDEAGVPKAGDKITFHDYRNPNQVNTLNTDYEIHPIGTADELASLRATSILDGELLQQQAYDLGEMRDELEASKANALELGGLAMKDGLELEHLKIAHEKLKDELEKLRAQVADMGWVSVEGRLPEATSWVLCSGGGAIACYAWNATRNRWEDWVQSVAPGLHVEDVTHWMPLPQPPENRND